MLLRKLLDKGNYEGTDEPAAYVRPNREELSRNTVREEILIMKAARFDRKGGTNGYKPPPLGDTGLR